MYLFVKGHWFQLEFYDQHYRYFFGYNVLSLLEYCIICSLTGAY